MQVDRDLDQRLRRLEDRFGQPVETEYQRGSCVVGLKPAIGAWQRRGAKPMCRGNRAPQPLNRNDAWRMPATKYAAR